MDQTSVELHLLPLAGGEGAHQPPGLLRLLGVRDGQHGEGAVPSPGNDGPGQSGPLQLRDLDVAEVGFLMPLRYSFLSRGHFLSCHK